MNVLCGPDYRSYPDALAILENARAMRNDEGHTVADAVEKAMMKALRQDEVGEEKSGAHRRRRSPSSPITKTFSG